MSLSPKKTRQEKTRREGKRRGRGKGKERKARVGNGRQG